MGSYRDLVAWQKAMDLAEQIYSVTRVFPPEERYGLVAQLRRCAVSIPSNIAEGHGRLTTQDWPHFLSQARGSVLELQTQILLSRRLEIGSGPALSSALDLAEELGKILNGLLKSTVQRRSRKFETN